MHPLFTLLFLVSLLALGIGQIRPGWVLPWKTKTRGRAALAYGTASVVFLLLATLAAPVPPPVYPEEAQTKTTAQKGH